MYFPNSCYDFCFNFQPGRRERSVPSMDSHRHMTYDSWLMKLPDHKPAHILMMICMHYSAIQYVLSYKHVRPCLYAFQYIYVQIYAEQAQHIGSSSLQSLHAQESTSTR